MNNQDILLSLCIPTYNRIEKLIVLVKKILDVDLPNIEVVVVDNCSTDGTKERLKKIEDSRFRYIEQTTAVTGISNIVCAINSGQGNFSLLCLDKDYIDVHYLGQFVELLCQNPNLVYGQCALNMTQFQNNEFYDQGIDTLLRIGYDCHHPSGLFVRNEVLKRTHIIERILLNYNSFAFNVDLIKAQLIMNGEGCYIYSPLMSTETLEEAAKERSHTYSGDNIWFSPPNIMHRMLVFMDHANSLGLSQLQFQKIIFKIYEANLHSLMIDFKRIMSNDALCAHHGIDKRIISDGELIKNFWYYALMFLKSDIAVSRMLRLSIVMIVGAKWSVRLIIRK